jgi:hypothetical protein
MEFIAHRINTIIELNQTPNEYGVEIDLRDYGERLVLQHDPFTDGEDFEEYLQHYNHGTMILNIKSERIEHRVLVMLKKYNIKKYFFLDSSFPMIQLLSNAGEKNIALRLSEFEGLDTISNMKEKVNWIWVDCFTKYPLTEKKINYLKDIGFKICIVSPELQGHDIETFIKKELKLIRTIKFDAVCTKKPIFWEKQIKF